MKYLFTLIIISSCILMSGCVTPIRPITESVDPKDPHRTERIHKEKAGWILERKGI